MSSLSGNNQADVIEAFNSTSKYLDGLLNIDSPYFKQMAGLIYPIDLQLNKTNSSDTEALFLDLDLSKTNHLKYRINEMGFSYFGIVDSPPPFPD